MTVNPPLDAGAAATIAGTDRVLLIGVGDAGYHDDGVGPAVIDRLCRAGLVAPSPPRAAAAVSLRERWRRADLAIVVSAARHDPTHPGRIHTRVIDRPDADPDPGRQLVNALAGAPRRIVLYAVQGAVFTAGRGLTAELAPAVDRLVGRISRDLAAETSRDGRGAAAAGRLAW